MKNDIDDIAKQKESLLTFTFNQENGKLLIKAQSEKTLYCGFLEPNSSITFDKIKKVLLGKNYEIVSKDDREMEITIAGVIDLHLKSQGQVSLQFLKDTIQKLTIKVETQAEKNIQLELIVKKLQNEILSIKKMQEQQKFAQQQKYQELKNQVSQIKNQSLQNKTNFEFIDQEKTQKITNLTAQLTQLRTNFDQVITQTIYKCITYETLLFRQSKIVCKPQEEITIKKFFDNKTIKSAKLLYRASENGFCAKKFHEKCDGIGNTLTVISTEFNKKIGGFTTLKWSSINEFVADNKKESFIFSLTHNDKFTLQQPEKTILNFKDYGPIFGGGNDLAVVDKSNSTKAYANLCQSYHNQKYKCNDKASWQRFHGTTASPFKTLEWQVWVLQFA